MRVEKEKRITLIVVITIIIALVAILWLIKYYSETQNENISANLEIPLNISSVNLNELKEKGMPIILDFGADSCIPCVEMAPVLEKLNLEYQEKAIIQFVDVWKYPEAAENLPVSIIPTQIFINPDGTPYEPSESVINSISGFQVYVIEGTDTPVYTTHQGGLTEEEMKIILAEMGATI